jgi:hypothetical protein
VHRINRIQKWEHTRRSAPLLVRDAKGTSENGRFSMENTKNEKTETTAIAATRNDKKEPMNGRIPFKVTHRGITIFVKVTPQGDRYWADSPWERTESGRARKNQSQFEDVVKKEITDDIDRNLGYKIPVSRQEFEALNRKTLAFDEIERSLEGTGLTPAMLMGQIIPTARRLHGAGVVVADAFQDGAACHLPRTPMKLEQVVKDLLPCVKDDCTRKHTHKLASDAEPLIRLAAGRDIHLITAVELEQMLRDFQEGKFLTEEEKRKWLIKKKLKSAPRTKDGREKWYSDKSKKHLFDACRRIFIRARKLGGWPLLLDLPTEAMEKPKVGRSQLPPLSAASWAKLVAKLLPDELRVAVLLFADIRGSEFDRLSPQHIKTAPVFHQGWTGPETLPHRIDVPPGYDKGKKEQQEGRVVTLLPTMRVLLHLAMPKPGQPLFPCKVGEIIRTIYKKAKRLGIKEVSHNCIRRMHDTYWYELKEAATAINQDASHTKVMSDRAYRVPASFEDAVRVFRTLPEKTPLHLRAWIEAWVGSFERQHGLVVSDLPEADENPDPANYETDTASHGADQLDLELLPGIAEPAAK